MGEALRALLIILLPIIGGALGVTFFFLLIGRIFNFDCRELERLLSFVTVFLIVLLTLPSSFNNIVELFRQ